MPSARERLLSRSGTHAAAPTAGGLLTPRPRGTDSTASVWFRLAMNRRTPPRGPTFRSSRTPLIRHSPPRSGYETRVKAVEGGPWMPSKSANVKNEKQYEALKDKGMSKERAAKIANSKDSSKHGGQQSGKGGNSSQGGTTAQKKKAGRKGGKASHS